MKSKDIDRVVEAIRSLDKTESLEKKEAEKKSKWRERITFWTALVLAAFSIYTGINSMKDNRETERRNLEIQAYTVWNNYLDLGAKNPTLANGLVYIDTVRVDSLACRDCRKKPYDSAIVNKFVKYAWFVNSAFGAADLVLSLQESDTAWNKAVDELIKNHATYVKSECFETGYFSEALRKKIEAERK